MTQVLEIDSEQSFANFKQTFPSSALAILYFYASWAQPCKQMSSVLEALASTYPTEDPPHIAFLSIDCEEHSAIAEDHDVTAVPFIVLQRGDKTLETISGSDASKIRKAVEAHFSKSTTSSHSLPPEQQVEKPSVEDSAVESSKDVADAVPKSPTERSQIAPSSSATPVDRDELFKRLEQLVKAAPVMLFMKGTPSSPQCGFSRQTVSLLREKNIRYGFFNILADDDVRQGLKEYSEWPTFPQVYVQGELVGGLDIIKEELAKNPDFLAEYSVIGQKTDASVATTEATA